MSSTAQIKIEDREFWNDLLNDKDSLSLREMGEKYGVAPSAIVAAFKRNGISRKPAPSGPRDQRRPDRDQATSGPTKDRARPDPRPNSKDSKILKYWEELGVLPDTDIAKRARVPARTIGKFRELHGIPPANAAGIDYSRQGREETTRETPSVRRAREIEELLTPYEALLGRVPDSVVAQMAILPMPSVRHERQKRGIPAAGKLPQAEIADILVKAGFSADAAEAAQEETPAPAPERAPAPRPAPLRAPARSALQAWKVTVQRGNEPHMRVVVAGSFVSAAELAQSWAGSDGQVVLVEALGPALA